MTASAAPASARKTPPGPGTVSAKKARVPGRCDDERVEHEHHARERADRGGPPSARRLEREDEIQPDEYENGRRDRSSLRKWQPPDIAGEDEARKHA